MRLHIAQNEKIINRCIANFEEVFPGENRWIILYDNNGNGRDYIEDRKEVIKCKFDNDYFWKAVGDMNVYKKIIVHFLTPESAKFIRCINHPEVYWIEWGADLYNVLLQCKGYKLYSDEKIAVKYSQHPGYGVLYSVYREIALRKKGRLYYAAAKKVKYFVPDSMYDEYPLLLKYYPGLKNLQYKEFFYYPINEVLGSDFDQCYTNGNNIMLGNSAAVTGNHFEVLDLLSKVPLGERSIITPLSYGLKTYANDVEKYGNTMFPNRFHALKEYMPLNDYNEVLRSANIFIYNNYRQEAVGNILIALYLGGKVFLNKRNPLLRFYKSLGLKIYELEELVSDAGFIPLNEFEIMNNRDILMRHYSRERQLELIKQNM